MTPEQFCFWLQGWVESGSNLPDAIIDKLQDVVNNAAADAEHLPITASRLAANTFQERIYEASRLERARKEHEIKFGRQSGNI